MWSSGATRSRGFEDGLHQQRAGAVFGDRGGESLFVAEIHEDGFNAGGFEHLQEEGLMVAA